MRSQFQFVRAGLAAAVLSLPQLASAASASWTGGGTTGNFSDGANWSTGTAPGRTSGAYTPDIATFDSSLNTIVTVGSRGLASLTLDTGAGAFTFKDGTIYTRYVSINAGVTQSQTFYTTIGSYDANPDLNLTNNSTTQGVIFNFRGTLLGGNSASAPYSVNLGKGAGSGAIVWGAINDVSSSKATALNLLDGDASTVILKSNASNFSGPVSVAKGAVFFNSVSNVGGGPSSFGAATTVANGTFNLSGALRFVYFYYTGSGSVTDRVLNNTGTGIGIDLSSLGTGALVWNGNYTNSGSAVSSVVLSGFNTSENRYGGIISDGGGTAVTSLTKYGRGTWNVSGANTYTGGTTVNEGLLRADFSVAGAPTSNIISASSVLTMNGGVFAVRGATSGSSAQTVNGITLNRGGSTVAADGNGGSGTTLNLNAINRTQGSTLNVETSSGGVVTTSTAYLNNGVLASASSGGVAYATVNGADWATISGGNIVALTSYQTDFNPANWVSTDNVSLSGNPSAAIGTQTINTLKVSGAANVGIQSSKTLTLGAGGLLFTGSGTQSISGGSLTSGTTVKELVIRQNNTGSIVDISSTITGAGMVLTKTGAGTLSLSGANNYTGSTVIAEGVLKGTPTTNIPNSAIYLAGGVLGLTGDFTGLVSTGGSGPRVAWSNSGGFAAYGGNRTISLTDNGSSTLNWGQSGRVFLQGGQALILGATDADATLLWTNAINLNGGNAGNSVMREVRVNDGTADVDAEMSGVISSPTATVSGKQTQVHAGLIKTGTGTLRLTAANTYDGPTIISAGTLIVNGSIGNSMLTTVYSGATLAGTGSSAQIELMAGGAMSPGDGGVGTFSTSQNGNSDFNWHGEGSGDFAQMKFELSNIDATSDRLALGSGILSKADGIVFKFDFLNTGLADTTYTLISFGGSLNFLVSDFTYTNLAGGLTGQFTLTDNALLFTTSAIPEPSQVFLIMAGLVVVVFFRRSVGRRSVANISQG